MVTFNRVSGKRTSRTFEAPSMDDALQTIKDAGFEPSSVWERIAHRQKISEEKLVVSRESKYCR